MAAYAKFSNVEPDRPATSLQRRGVVSRNLPTVKGTVTKIEHAHQRGEIRAADGTEHPFARDGMGLGWQFDDLQPGTPVSFDLEGSNRATNVRRVK